MVLGRILISLNDEQLDDAVDENRDNKFSDAAYHLKRGGRR